jgi:hypothetical protein
MRDYTLWSAPYKADAERLATDLHSCGGLNLVLICPSVRQVRSGRRLSQLFHRLPIDGARIVSHLRVYAVQRDRRGRRCKPEGCG